MASSHATEGRPGIADIRDAALRLRDVSRGMPLIESDGINARTGARVLVKCETFQPIGAFKIRGAWNRVSRLSGDVRARGIVTSSSGNHAQAVALSARRLGIGATILMPSDAPPVKMRRTRQMGADVVTYDRATEDRETKAAELRDRTGGMMIHPYDDPLVIAGQGTVGLEIAEECRERDIRVDAAIAPCGGGGLVAGCAIALHAFWPEAEVYAAEPEGFDDTRRSLVSGRREVNARAAGSICDAILVPTPGEVTFAINRTELAGGVAVSDDEVKAAMRTAFAELRVVAEPGGAVALAAILAGKLDVAGRTVAVVLSGGNVDPALFSEIVAEA